jgi:hypothetical protein
MPARSAFRRFIGPIFLVAISCPAGISTAQDDILLEGRFKAEAPKAWSVLDATEDQIEVVGTMTSFKVPKTDHHFRYIRMGPRGLYQFEQEKVAAGEIRCITPDKGFVLKRNEPNGPWAIKSLGRSGDMAEKAMKEFFDRQYIVQEQTATHGFLGKRLSQLISEPAFRLKSVEPLVRDGVNLARVSFQYESTIPGRPDKEVTSNELILRPDKYWSVQEVISKSANGNSSTTRLEYGDDEGGLPTLRSFLMAIYFRDGNGVWGTFERADKFSKYSYKPIPDEAFAVTAFGLPDPDRRVGRLNGWRAEWWFLGLAIAFGLLAIALRIRWSRFARAQTVNAP